MTNEEEFKLRCELIERYGEDSEEVRVHRWRAAANQERIERGAKILAAIAFVLLILVQCSFGGGGSYGRYNADMHMLYDDLNPSWSGSRSRSPRRA